MNLFLIILTGLVISATAAFSTTSHLFNNLASNKLKNNVNVETQNLASLPNDVLGESTEQESVTFNVDAIFNKALIIKNKITADNIVYGIKPGAGISIGAGQTPVITNTGVTSLAGKTGELKLEQGSGITIDGLKITNSGITSLTSGTGITVSGSTITNSDLGSSQNIFKTISVSGQDNIVAGSNTDTLTFTAGAGITLSTDATNDKLTITSNDPSIAGGWTHAGTDIHLTTSTDSVGIGTTDPSYKLHVVGTGYVSDTLTAGGALSVSGNTTLSGNLSANGNVTLGNATTDSLTFVGRIANGTSLLPDTDLGADLGSSLLRFNNLWVANINSNSSQSFAGQTTFSYAPTDTTIAQASVLINPTTSAANGQLLALGVAGYQKALIDEDGDMVLGYSNLTSAPATDNPLMIYGHNGTNVASIDTSGNLNMGTGLTSSGALSITTSGDFALNTSNLFIESTNSRVGIGTVTPAQTLTVVGDLASSVATGVEGLKLTDTTDVTKLAMKWNSTGVNFDIPGLASTNKLTNGTFETDITTGGWNQYALNDQFTTPLSGGAVNGTSAEPTGGTRTVVDTNGKLSISGGQLSFATGGVDYTSNPKISYGTTSRVAGKTLVNKLNVASGVGSFGFDDNIFSYNGTSLYDVGNSTKIVATVVNNTEYLFARVLRTSGYYAFIKGGIYTNWTLLYISTGETTASLTPSIQSYLSFVATADNIRIPTSTWLPTPLAYDTFTRADGAIGNSETTGPDSQTTPSLAWSGGAISTNKNVITPSLGSELVTNGDFASDTWWVKDPGWTISGGTANVNSSSSVSVYKGPSFVTQGKFYKITYDITSYTSGIIRSSIGGNGGSQHSATGSFSDILQATGNTYAGIGIIGTTVASVDNVSIKEIPFSSTFSSVSTSDADVIADANVTLTAGTQAGLVLNLDSASSPANFIIVYHNGTSVIVDEAVAGVYTNKQTTTVTYSAGATLRAIREGTKLRVYYNNALVGAELTMTANTNTKHGLFSTYSGNSFDNFTLWARGTGNEYVNLPDTDLTATKDTTVHYSGASSLKLVAGTSDNGYTQAYTLPDTSNYTLSTFAYTDGSAVTSADLSLENGNVNLATTYTSVGNGWYKLSASFTGVASSRNYGVKVKAGRTVYVDNLSLFASASGVNVLGVSNSTTGLGGLSVESTTTLNSGLASLQALIVKGFSGQTANLQEWHTSAGSVLASLSSTGGLTLEGNLDINGTTSDVAGALNLSGNALTSSGALSITPASGNNLNIALSGTGDFAVNTNQLYVDTSAGNVGIGLTAPSAKLHIISTTEQLRLGYDTSNYWSNTVGATGGLTMQGVGTGGSLTLSPTAGQNLNISLATTGDMVVNTNDLVVDTSSGYIGINTTAPTALLDLAGTSGTDAFRLTNSGTKVLGLSYATNNVTFDQTSTDPTNKLLNPTFDSDLTSWSEVPSYTLNDQFTTNRAAGAVNGTSAEPTGGTRTVVDTTNKLSLSSGNLTFNVLPNNEGIVYGGISRIVGKMMIHEVTPTTRYTASGFSMTNGSPSNTVHRFIENWDGTLSAGDSSPIVVDSVSTGASRQQAIILRSTGAYYFLKKSTGNWQLVHIGNQYNTSTIYPSLYSSSSTTATFDNIRIPTETWLPTPLAYSTFATGGATSTETVGPDSQTTPSLALTGGTVAGGTLSISPSLGSETLTNAGLEAPYSGGVANGYTASGTPTEETTVVHGGTSSQKIVAVGSQGPQQSLTGLLTTGNWYQASMWIYSDIQLPYFQIHDGTSIFGGNKTLTTLSAWNQLVQNFRATNTGSYIRNLSNTNSTFYDDDFSLKPLTLSSLFSTVPTSDSDVIADANVTSPDQGVQAGVALNLNSASSPTEGVVAYLTRTNATTGATVTLDKFTTATAWTNVQAATAVTYSAGATLRVIKSGTAYRVYYNNALVGAEKTISDATLIDNTIHGVFSTYSTNSFDNFTLWPRGSGTTKFTDAPFEELTATRDTGTKYNNSTASVQLVTSGTDANYVQSVNVGDTSTYNLIAYAYTNGTAVTSADLSLYYDTAALTTTYAPMGGTGWYKLTGSFTGVASAKDYGVRVKAGKTVYVDEMHLQVGTGTSQTMYVLNSNTGVTGLNVQGLINGTLNGVASYSKAGTISDSDFVTATDGLFGFDTTNHRLYFREGGAWSYIARTAGFQIPKEEVLGLTTGDYLLPYVESFMSDGAVHGLYQKFDLNKLLATQGAVKFVSDVTFLGKTVFNKDMAGTAIISTYSSQVDVKFTNIYDISPIVTMNLVIDASDSAFIEDGQKAYLTNVTPSGFSIMLPTLALRDYMYNWIAISTNETNVTKSQSVIQEIINNITPTETPVATDTPTIIP